MLLCFRLSVVPGFVEASQRPPEADQPNDAEAEIGERDGERLGPDGSERDGDLENPSDQVDTKDVDFPLAADKLCLLDEQEPPQDVGSDGDLSDLWPVYRVILQKRRLVLPMLHFAG